MSFSPLLKLFDSMRFGSTAPAKAVCDGGFFCIQFRKYNLTHHSISLTDPVVFGT